MSESAMTTLGVPEPTVIRKSGMRLPLTRVRVSKYAITQEMTIPNDAAIVAETKLFLAEPMIAFLVKMVFQYFSVIFCREIGFPIFTVKEVNATVTNGITTTTNANRHTKMVIGILHLPKSTMFGRVDFPDTVIYWRFPTTNVETYNTIFAIIMRNTASVVASVKHSCEPM